MDDNTYLDRIIIKGQIFNLSFNIDENKLQLVIQNLIPFLNEDTLFYFLQNFCPKTKIDLTLSNEELMNWCEYFINLLLPYINIDINNEEKEILINYLFFYILGNHLYEQIRNDHQNAYNFLTILKNIPQSNRYFFWFFNDELNTRILSIYNMSGDLFNKYLNEIIQLATDIQANFSRKEAYILTIQNKIKDMGL